jgi:hypothetical protein
MKFKLKEDWLYESIFLGKKITKKLYDKGHIFEPEDGFYKITHHTGEIVEITVDEMRESKILEEVFDTPEIIIEEIPDDDDILVRNWRIQLDVRTTRKKLKEFEEKFRESIGEL